MTDLNLAQSDSGSLDFNQRDLELINHQNYGYVGEMYIGNPPQLLRALFDTGSTDTWTVSINSSI